jgi:carboxyl-terminal processing protease
MHIHHVTPRSGVRLRGLATGAFALATILSACSTAAPAPPPSHARAAVTPELATLTFDSAWSRIEATHYDTAYAGVDWHGVRAELRPRAAAARTLDELRAVISEMLARLGESHFSLIPHEAADALGPQGGTASQVTGDAGLAVRLIDDEIVVTRVGSGGGAEAAGIATGWTLLAIDEILLAPRLRSLFALPEQDRRTARTRLLYGVNGALAGLVGDTLLLRLRSGDGTEIERPVALTPSPGSMVRFGNLPPVLALLEHEALPAGDSCVGLIRLNVWMVPLSAEFDRAVDELRHCSGMIVDLRGNPGGVAGMVMGTAGHFLNDTLALGFMKTRGNELRFKANPRRVRADGTPVQPFAGPLAVLMDEMSASTSEFFAAGLQGVGRARVFGTSSAGQALPAAMLRLPTNDVLMHVIADFTGPGGVRMEGDGVRPDVTVTSTKQDLLAGRDATLDAAIDWITAYHSTTGGH